MTNGDILVQSSAKEINIAFNTPRARIADSGTRARFNGVIGGGPLGGVNLSSTTGQFDGDLAVADGTSAASDGAWARWDDSASNWQYVDPTGTI